MIEQYKCPLCNQPVSKQLFDKITGVWKAKQEAEKKFKLKLKELKDKKVLLENQYKSKVKKLKDQNKKKIMLEVKKKTSKLDLQITNLKKKNEEQERKTKEKIERIIKLEHVKSEKLVKQKEAKITKELRISQKKEIAKIKKREKELTNAKIKLEITKAQSKANQRVTKLEISRDAAYKQLSSFQKRNTEQEQQIQELKKQLTKETTPQIEGLLYEDKLLKVLKQQYPKDDFKHTGKGGDIIHFVKYNNSIIGTIVYECKKVKHFQTAHIKQAAEAKLKRNADYVILVTNATKKNYGGFSIEKGVVIIHPAGLLSLVNLLRRQLVVIANLKLTKAQREKAIQETIKFIESPEFKNRLDAVIQETIDLYDSLKKEIKDHIKVWRKRYDGYKKIHQETIHVKDKTSNLLSGEKQKELPSKKEYPTLPELTEEKE